MKKINNYILLVDYYKSPRLKRNTAGRYRVGAKSPQEAVKLLREKIGFGSIQVHYKCEENDKLTVPYKCVVKEVFKDGGRGAQFVHEQPVHANAPQKKG